MTEREALTNLMMFVRANSEAPGADLALEAIATIQNGQTRRADFWRAEREALK